MTSLRLFNSLRRELQIFEPQQPGRVGVYTCGPTVYDRAHIGNLRTFLFEDVLCRTLELFGYEVEQVMNLTDVEDKIIAGAVESGVSLEEYVQPHIDSFFVDRDRLRIRKAERYPRATHHVAEMIELITKLERAGFAYEADGSVFFRIEKDEDYGKLSGVDRSQQKRGERVAEDEYDREDVRDFVLWKGGKEGEPSWPSPWGDGRPGWHIECSAMSMKYLGETLDIHCGGVDNVFPHHENEIAQSESATECEFVRYWLHSEHLLVDNHKMSKSLGNQYTLDDLVDRGLDLRAVRYLFLSVHYRQKLNFTFRSVGDAASALRRVDEARSRLARATEANTQEGVVEALVASLESDFEDRLADDLNLSGALGVLHTFIRDLNGAIDRGEIAAGDRGRVEQALRRIDRVLGVLDRDDWSADGDGAADSAGLSDEQIDELVAARTKARGERDFEESDRIRDLLQEHGVILEDARDGTRWKRS